MACIYDSPIDAFCISQGSSSQKQILDRYRVALIIFGTSLIIVNVLIEARCINCITYLLYGYDAIELVDVISRLLTANLCLKSH